MSLVFQSPKFPNGSSHPRRDFSFEQRLTGLVLLGLAVFTGLLNTQVRSRFSKIEGYGTVFTEPKGSEGYAVLQNLPDGPIKDQVLDAFAQSFRVCQSADINSFAASNRGRSAAVGGRRQKTDADEMDVDMLDNRSSTRWIRSCCVYLPINGMV